MRRVVSLAIGMVLGCAPSRVEGDRPQEVRESKAGILWLSDDRQEAVDVSNWKAREVAMRSTFMFVCSSQVNVSDPANVVVSGNTLNDRVEAKYGNELCASERFANQVAPGFCTGVLIDHDLILTAAHCVAATGSEAEPCLSSSIQLIGNYSLTSGGSVRQLTSSDVFDVVGFAVEPVFVDSAQKSDDYAIVRLDRSATPQFQPVAVRTEFAPVPGNGEVTIAGHPTGLPLKVDDIGVVVIQGWRGWGQYSCTTDCDMFSSNSDAFKGNSGGGVFLRPGYELAGVLFYNRSGVPDYVTQSGASCATASECDESGCDVLHQYANKPFELLCENVPSSRVCRAEGKLHYFELVAAAHALTMF